MNESISVSTHLSTGSVRHSVISLAHLWQPTKQHRNLLWSACQNKLIHSCLSGLNRINGFYWFSDPYYETVHDVDPLLKLNQVNTHFQHYAYNVECTGVQQMQFVNRIWI